MFDYFLFISMNLDHFSKTNNFFNNYKNQNKKEKKNLTWISFFFAHLRFKNICLLIQLVQECPY